MYKRKKSLALGSAATFVGGSAGALLLALAAAPAGAVPVQYNVDTLDDGAVNASDCTTPVPDSCSLRDALDAVVGGDTIAFVSGLSGTITLTQGELEVASDIRLQGPGADLVTVDAGGNSRVFYICAGPNTLIEGLTITGGSDSKGGGLYDECGSGFTLRNVVVTGNEATSDIGGGLLARGPMTIIDSVFSNNTAVGRGGGMYVVGDLVMTGTILTGNTVSDSDSGGGGAFGKGNMTISSSTFDSNIVGDCGGGLYSAVTSGTVTITGSTFSNNEADNCYGGGIDIDGNYNDVLIANTTITGNSARSGGGLHLDFGNVATIAQTTIVGNTAISTDALYSGGGIHISEEMVGLSLSGTIVSGNSAVAGAADVSVGENPVPGSMTADDSLLGEVDSRIMVTGTGNIDSTTPGVEALADNGGPTKTMALSSTSPALDAGPATVAVFPDNEFDQRGVGFPRVFGTRVDIGAFESPGFPPEPSTTTTSTAEPVVPTFAG